MKLTLSIVILATSVALVAPAPAYPQGRVRSTAPSGGPSHQMAEGQKGQYNYNTNFHMSNVNTGNHMTNNVQITNNKHKPTYIAPPFLAAPRGINYDHYDDDHSSYSDDDSSVSSNPLMDRYLDDQMVAAKKFITPEQQALKEKLLELYEKATADGDDSQRAKYQEQLGRVLQALSPRKLAGKKVRSVLLEDPPVDEAEEEQEPEPSPEELRALQLQDIRRQLDESLDRLPIGEDLSDELVEDLKNVEDDELNTEQRAYRQLILCRRNPELCSAEATNPDEGNPEDQEQLIDESGAQYEEDQYDEGHYDDGQYNEGQYGEPEPEPEAELEPEVEANPEPSKRGSRYPSNSGRSFSYAGSLADEGQGYSQAFSLANQGSAPRRMPHGLPVPQGKPAASQSLPRRGHQMSTPAPSQSRYGGPSVANNRQQPRPQQQVRRQQPPPAVRQAPQQMLRQQAPQKQQQQQSGQSNAMNLSLQPRQMLTPKSAMNQPFSAQPQNQAQAQPKAQVSATGPSTPLRPAPVQPVPVKSQTTPAQQRPVQG